MTNREYIESGTLELYAAGLLSIEEMREVEHMACQYSEIKTELEDVQASLEKYAISHSMNPPSGIREKILKRIEGESETGELTKKTHPIVREISPARTISKNYLAIASILLLIVAAAFAIRYAAEANHYKQQFAQLKRDNDSSTNVLIGTMYTLATVQEQLAVLSDTNTVRVTMKGTPVSPHSMAMIYWNKATKTVYIDVKSLPAAAAGKQYQLWFINPSLKPVSAGMFDPVAGKMLKMINAPAAIAFAVTLEPHGGSASPTMAEMYVLGKVNS